MMSFDPNNPSEGGDGGRDYSVPPPPAIYLLGIERWERLPSRSSEFDYVKIAFVIQYGEFEKRWIWENLSMNPSVDWKWSQLFKALGWTEEHGLIDRDSDDELSRWFDSGLTLKAKTFVETRMAMNHGTGCREQQRNAKIKEFIEADGDTDSMPLGGVSHGGGYQDPGGDPGPGDGDVMDPFSSDFEPGGQGGGGGMQGDDDDSDMPF